MRYLSHARKQQSLLAFAARVRTGIFGYGSQVGHQTVEKALRHVSQTLVLAGYPDPRRTYGAKELDIPFRHLLKAYKDVDPAPKPQLALPVDTIQYAAAHFREPHDALSRATADLVTVAFFFLLRVGEYTMPTKKTRTWTVQFRLKDVRFHHRGVLLPHTTPLALLLQADAATLYMDNQKNGQRGATIHHHAHQGWFCPVKALARRVSAITQQGFGPDTPLSQVSVGVHVLPHHVVKLVRLAARQTNLVARGYPENRVGSHSLRASGAMALALTGAKDSTIMKMGRWTGLTFLTYIHSQIGALNARLSARMARIIPFQNVEG